MTLGTGTGARLTVVAALAAGSWLVPAPASATSYRYWTYWSGAGPTWAFSQVGPASAVPKNGAVEGWRFAVSTGTRGQEAQPRIAPKTAFAQFCGEATPPAGQKRVVIVFDFGDASDAPPGQSPPQSRGTCVQIERDATGAEILSQAADIRVEGGLVCAIGGYPRGECAPAVTPTPRPTPTPRKSKEPRREEPPPAQDTHDRGTNPGDVDDSGDAGGTPRPGGQANDAGTPKPAPSRPGKTPTPSASGSPTTTTAPGQESVAPEFVAADARVTEEPTTSWGLLAAALALAALGGVAVWRVRQQRR